MTKAKKNNKLKLTPKKMALLMAIISLVSFLYKLGLGIISTSMILIVASISTLIVCICKFLFWHKMNGTRSEKKRTYFFMMILALAFGVLFLLFAVLKVGGIDTASKNNFKGIFAYIFIAFVILMFVLSIINLKGALQKDDLVVIGIKEMIFVSALADAVIIEEFLYKVILKYQGIPFMGLINNYFPLITAVAMLMVPFYMLKRFRSYEA
jgi:uncharacterized membrane protein